MKRTIALFILLFTFSLVQSQQVFIKEGKIEYERKTNTHRLYFTGEEGSWVETFKKLTPQFKINYFDLLFDENKSIYKPGKEVEEDKTSLFESPAADNVVYKDLQHQTTVSQKQIFESKFLIMDSIRSLQWKLLPETREIAGFDCHKAIAKICDSVVVVAFYTDEIIPSSGPESFGNLPGMILELAIPRLYTTWTATKLESLTPADERNIMAPAKGKKANDKEVADQVKNGIKDWNVKWYHRYFWWATL